MATGEFAQFGEPPVSSGFGHGQQWRAEAGREWHKVLRSLVENAAATTTPPATSSAVSHTTTPNSTPPSSDSPVPTSAACIPSPSATSAAISLAASTDSAAPSSLSATASPHTPIPASSAIPSAFTPIPASIPSATTDAPPPTSATSATPPLTSVLASASFPSGAAGQWLFEHSVRTTLLCERWTITAEGRADQLFIPADPDMPLVVREIKTVSESLPRPAAHWRENRPAFFTQLALYCHGLSQIPAHTKRGVTGVLVLAEPATGIIQEVPLDGAPSAWLAPRASRFARFAESRWNSRLRLEHLRLLNPFAESRAEWDVAAGQLAAENAPAILLEAPTGFGKTSLALVDALHHLRDGEVSRIVYVTGKNSGRLQVLRELSRLTEPGALRALTLHSRAEHEVAGVPREPEVWVQNWRRAAIDPGALFDSGETELAAVRALGERVGVPPWEITKTLLPLAELILCDYNYVFSPWQAGVLGGMDGWDPAATLLIADEAHNLPERAAEARSIVCDAARAADALDALRYAGVRGGWLREWEAWAEFLAALPQANALEPLALYLARDHCAEITRLWEEQNPLHYELPQDTIDALERPAQLLPILEASPENYFFWSPRPRCFRAACLDAAVETGETLRAFHRAVLMSATLSPPNDFAEAVGLSLAASANTPPTAPPSRPPTALAPPDSVFLSVAAPWRFDAYEVAADVRVDTRLKSRERHFRATAESVLSLAAAEPAAVFFPSFAYAETIKTYIAALDSGFQVFVQPRGATPDENAAFLTEALLLAHAIFLVAGGGLAESVDMLGGRITRAMVVSPCLPEVSAERAAKMALRERAGDGDPFRSAYLLPALRKVNQALGRLVRAPDQRAKVVLHCRRFADPNLAALLAPEYRGGRLIRNAHEWAEFTA